MRYTSNYCIFNLTGRDIVVVNENGVISDIPNDGNFSIVKKEEEVQADWIPAVSLKLKPLVRVTIPELKIDEKVGFPDIENYFYSIWNKKAVVIVPQWEFCVLSYGNRSGKLLFLTPYKFTIKGNKLIVKKFKIEEMFVFPWSF